jgi:hypothetical protein
MTTTNADDAALEARPISVECDWCGQKLDGRIRRGQVGRMVVIQAPHRDRAGRPCLGSGRAIGAWPLSVELRALGDSYEVRIGARRPRTLASRDALARAIQDLGVEGDEARVWAAAVAPGQPATLEVPERRRNPRPREGREALRRRQGAVSGSTGHTTRRMRMSAARSAARSAGPYPSYWYGTYCSGCGRAITTSQSFGAGAGVG